MFPPCSKGGHVWGFENRCIRCLSTRNAVEITRRVLGVTDEEVQREREAIMDEEQEAAAVGDVPMNTAQFLIERGYADCGLHSIKDANLYQKQDGESGVHFNAWYYSSRLSIPLWSVEICFGTGSDADDWAEVTLYNYTGEQLMQHIDSIEERLRNVYRTMREK